MEVYGNYEVYQENLEHYADLIETGRMSAEEANVELIRAMRVRVVRGKIPKEIRKYLNTAVKEKKLAHYKKEGLKPEVYYHPNFKDMAVEAREHEEYLAKKALTSALYKIDNDKTLNEYLNIKER